jgi:hypothetical protein
MKQIKLLTFIFCIFINFNSLAETVNNSINSELIKQSYCKTGYAKELTLDGRGRYTSITLDYINSGTIPEVVFTLKNELTKDLNLEKTLIEYVKEDHIYPEVDRIWFYNKFDLNNDGIDEAIVQIIGPNECAGNGGCGAYIFQLDNAKNYKLIKSFSIVREIYATFDFFNGWNELILAVSGGGIPLNYQVFRVFKNDLKYHPITNESITHDIMCKKNKQLRAKYAISIFSSSNAYKDDLKEVDGYWKLSIHP